jgi:hypothetical protein
VAVLDMWSPNHLHRHPGPLSSQAAAGTNVSRLQAIPVDPLLGPTVTATQPYNAVTVRSRPSGNNQPPVTITTAITPQFASGRFGEWFSHHCGRDVCVVCCGTGIHAHWHGMKYSTRFPGSR